MIVEKDVFRIAFHQKKIDTRSIIKLLLFVSKFTTYSTLEFCALFLWEAAALVIRMCEHFIIFCENFICLLFR